MKREYVKRDTAHEIGVEQEKAKREKPKARQGWDEAFQEMAAREDDELLDGDVLILSDWDENEWEW